MLDTFGKYQGIANAMESNKYIQANTAQTQQQTAQSGNDYASKQLGSFLSLPQPLRTQANARQLIDHLVQGNMVPAQVGDVWHDMVNKTPNQPALDQLVARGIVSLHSGPEMANQIFGQNDLLQTGGSQVPVAKSTPLQRFMQPGTPGMTQTGGDVGNTLTPGEQNAVVPLPTMGSDGKPTGGSTPTTGAGVAVRGGNQHLLPGGGAWPGTPDGRLPPALTNPNRPGAAPTAPMPPPVSGAPVATPAVAPVAHGTLGTTLTPGEAANQTNTANAAAKGFQDISDQGVQARMRRSIYQNMLAETSLFTPGAGADKIKQIEAIITRVAGPNGAARLGLDPSKLAANDSFDKWAAQLGMASNPGSDARMNLNTAANPTSHTTNADYLVRQLIGNEDYQIAHAGLAQKHPDQTDLKGFQAGTGSQLDPRVFQYARLSPEQKTTYLTSMKSPADQAAFIKNYQWAEQNNLLGGQ